MPTVQTAPERNSGAFGRSAIPGGIAHDESAVFLVRNAAAVAPAPDRGPGPEHQSLTEATIQSATPVPQCASECKTCTQSANGRRRSYWRRRMDNMEEDDNDLNKVKKPDDASNPSPRRHKFSAGSIGSLPLSMQSEFRRKVLLIFAMQLLLLTAFVAALTFIPALDRLLHDAFDVAWYLFLSFAVMLALLGLLYKFQSSFPLNWFILVLFTGGLGVLAAGVQIPMKTDSGLFCSFFTFLSITMMGVITSTTRRVHGHVRFFSPMVAGIFSFAVFAIVSIIIYDSIGWHFVTRPALWYSIVLEFVLLLWFSYDASEMFNVITPDEYMNGVVYFYVDLVIITFISVTIGALIFVCSMCSGAGGGGFGFGSLDCYGCACCTHGNGNADGRDDGIMEGNGTPLDVLPAAMDR